jgi:hypothetical protein
MKQSFSAAIKQPRGTGGNQCIKYGEHMQQSCSRSCLLLRLRPLLVSGLKNGSSIIHFIFIAHFILARTLSPNARNISTFNSSRKEYRAFKSHEDVRSHYPVGRWSGPFASERKLMPQLVAG